MNDDKNHLEQAVEQAMDTFVYAPIGLIFDGPALFPKLVEKGRDQVQVARMMGQMAVQMGQSEAEKRVGRAQGQVLEGLAAAGLVPRRASDSTPSDSEDVAPTSTASSATKKPGSKPAPKKKTASNKTGATKKPATKNAATKNAATKGKAPAVGTLGIPDYDSLSASQVVTRLRGLAAPDLEAVKVYEAATRARKTILNRITQLQKS